VRLQLAIMSVVLFIVGGVAQVMHLFRSPPRRRTRAGESRAGGASSRRRRA